MKTFKPNAGLRVMNPLIGNLIRTGLPMGPMALLTVPGRNSGLPRSTPVALIPIDGGWRLVAAYGLVDWVKNLRAAGKATIRVKGRQVEVSSHELPPSEAAPILRESLAVAGPITRRVVGPYFDTDPKASLLEWEREAQHHPVFRLTVIPP
jgi:deazaflavin-dependent oxidoreductase (nitroreductase family)